MVQGRQDTELMHHIATCEDCQNELPALRQLARYQATTGGIMTEPTPSLVDRMAALLPIVRPDLADRARPGEGLLDRARRFTAELLSDTGATPQLAGLRGGVDGRTRQLAFVSEVADLDLEVARFEDGFSVAGQLGMDVVPPNLLIRFVPADQDPLAEEITGSVRAAISNGGYFELSLTSGEWVAAVDIEDAVVLFPGVRL